MIERHLDTFRHISRHARERSRATVSYCWHLLPYIFNTELQFWWLLFPSATDEGLQELAQNGIVEFRGLSSWPEHALLHQESLTR
jgi:hypothetical protein